VRYQFVDCRWELGTPGRGRELYLEGHIPGASFLDVDEETWDTVVDLNLKGSYFGAQAAARQMVAQGDGGRIVFSSSVTGTLAIENISAYAVTKAGLQHMARVLALDCLSIYPWMCPSFGSQAINMPSTCCSGFK